MGKSCTILAHVKNFNGEIVESNLFKDLLHYTNDREISKQYYKVGTDETFLSKVRDKTEYKEDENGEITFDSLRVLSKMDLDNDRLISTLNKDIHAGNYSYEDALKKVQYFNENNKFSESVMATMVPSSNGNYFVSVIPTSKKVSSHKGRKEGVTTVNSDAQQKLYNTVRNKEVEKRIIDLLNRHKVSVKFLEGNREGGRYSTENIEKVEDGLYGLIEINEGKYVTDNLAEEAGHFAIGALGDYPLVRRLESLLSTENMQKEALGEEYNNALLGNNPAREVAGKLVGKALQRKLGNGGAFNVLANRIANLARRIFYNFTGNEVRWAAAKAEQIANKIAYKFIEGDSSYSVENAINIKETMYNAALSTNTKIYRDAIDELGRMSKALDAIADDVLAGQVKSSLGLSVIAGSDSAGKTALQYANEKIDSLADSLAFDGIVQAISQVTDYLGNGSQIDRLMSAVDLNNPAKFYENMARNGKYLHQARVFLNSAEKIIDLVYRASISEGSEDSLKIGNGRTLDNVRYQDKDGIWKTLNLRNTLTSYKAIIGIKKSRLTNLESAYFARFCEDIYGKKYISTTTGKLWKDIWQGNDSSGETIISIADMVKGEGMDDIDIFHRFVGSMANNPDVIGQIVDKLVKMSNKIADDESLRYQEKLMILKDRASKLGLNIEDLYEKDINGIPTGNLITPPPSPTEYGNREEDFICQAYLADMDTDDISELYAVNHSRWEKEREEYKKECWEKFKQKNPDWQSLSGFMRGYKWDEYFRPKMKHWNEENSIKVVVKDNDGNTKYVKWVPNAIYETDAWNGLEEKYPKRGSDSLRRWMHDYMELKTELDSRLPPGSTVSYRAPQFRGTFGNAVRSKANLESGLLKNTKASIKTFGRRAILESFVETADDTDYGSMNTMNNPDEELLGTKLDYEEERAARLPIFGINKLKNMVDLSTDIFSSTLAYASMATTYYSLNSIVDSLEVGRSALLTRDSKIKKGNIEREGSTSRAYGRYIKFLDKQVYGISAPYWGITLKNGKRFLLNKLVQNINSLGGTLFLKGNILGGAVNTGTGFNNIFKEATVGEFIDLKSWRKANRYYFSHFIQMWTPGFKSKGGDLGKLRKNNKLDLFLHQMNALSDNKEKFRSWHTNRSALNNFYRMSGYLPYSSGDHYMQAISYLAIANKTKLYNDSGEEVSNLWQAWEKKRNLDEKGEFDYGSTIEFNRLCPLDSSDITIESINDKGVYLKEVAKDSENFENWLLSQDILFIDKGYRSQHIDEYDDYRKTYNELSVSDLMEYQAQRLQMLKTILELVENYTKSNSPLSQIPVFTAQELEYLQTK